MEKEDLLKIKTLLYIVLKNQAEIKAHLRNKDPKIVFEEELSLFDQTMDILMKNDDSGKITPKDLSDPGSLHPRLPGLAGVAVNVSLERRHLLRH